ncbi:phosphoribosylglycinamide formyltransferase [Advenella sp. RU8]|uniref:phosphoribosylglycinamide formyltransferase n=1 Tax=Advenella sp. RU8 TaxID=3399575 RepID=UPI003AAE2D7A
MTVVNQSPKRFVLLISGRGSNMQAIVNMAKNRPDIHVAAVISHSRNSKGLEWAKEQGINVHEILNKDYDSRESFDQALQEIIDTHQPDYVLLAGFMRILTEKFVRHYHGRLINIHPSLLPSFPGLDTHQQALDAGVLLHGCTIHFVTPVLDHGPIIAQSAVPVRKTDTADDLAQRVLGMEHIMFPAVVGYLAEDIIELGDNGKVVYKREVPSLFMFSEKG